MKCFRLLGFVVFLLMIHSCTDKKDVIFNKVPKADAGPAIAIRLPISSVTLSGSGTDEDGKIVAYLWSQVSGPAPTTMTNPGSMSTLVKGLIQGNYLFQLMVTDDDGATGVDTVSVIVNPSLQQTITLQPANNPFEKMLVTIGGADHSFQGGNEWVIDAWTVGGQPYTGRKAFKFDLSNIPSTATIISANLYLYSNTPPENGNLVDANFGSNNTLVLQRIISNWSPVTANWNNQPSTTTANQVIIPHTPLSVLDINVDVKNMVADMVSNVNHGFLLKLQNEVAYQSRAFVSSYHTSKPQMHPKLVVTFQP